MNPHCEARENPDDVGVCQSCGTSLLIRERYRPLKLLSPLGGAQQAEVFEVEDTTGGVGIEVGTHLIMKVLLITNRFKPPDNKRTEFLFREVKVLKKADYSGIPKVQKDGFFVVKDPAIDQELHCLVQEKIEGSTLTQWIEEHGPISQDQAIDWLKQLSDSLIELFEIGYFHRDIKPDNIMCRPDGTVVLIDFGAVREITATYLTRIGVPPDEGRYDEALETTGIFTVGYAPPEQVLGKALPQSDFFALGRTFVQLLTGTHPRKLPADMDTGELTWRDKAPQISKPFGDFIDRLMSIAPGNRPQNAESLKAYLNTSFRRKEWTHALFRDRRFQIGAGALLLLLLLGGYKLGTYLVSRYYFQLALEQQQQRNFKTARNYYEHVIKFDPSDKTAHNNLGLVCQELQDLPCVLESYRKGLEIKPGDAVLSYNLGRIHDDFQEYGKAREYYQKAIDANPSYAQPVNNLARLDLIDEKPKQAEEQIGTVLNLAKHDSVKASLYKNLGWAQYQQKQYVQAIESLKTSSELNAEEISTYCLLAKAENAVGQPSSANWELCFFGHSKLPEVWQWKREFIKRNEE